MGQCAEKCEATDSSAVLSPGVTFAICLGAITAFVIWVVLFGTCLKRNQERWALARRALSLELNNIASPADGAGGEPVLFEPPQEIVWPRARCAVCMDKPPDSLCDPCGHIFCSSCFGKLEGWCAMCRGEIECRIVLQGLEAESGHASSVFGTERCVQCQKFGEIRSALNPCGHLLCSTCSETCSFAFTCPACEAKVGSQATIHWAAMDASEAIIPIDIHSSNQHDEAVDFESESESEEDDAAGSSEV
jgi:hypothetical protein